MKTSIATIISILVIISAGANRASAAELFNASEISLSFFGSWVDKDDSDLAPGAGITWFFTEHLGAGAFTHWENYEGTFIDNLSAEGYFRWPLGNLPLAPYGLVAFGYSFETEESFEALGAGAEWRFNEKWGAFGDVRWQFNNDTDDGVALRVGARLVF